MATDQPARPARPSPDEAGDELDRLREAIADSLPHYTLDDGTGDETNDLETVEFAGDEIRRSAAKLAAAEARGAKMREALLAANDLLDHATSIDLGVDRIVDLGQTITDALVLPADDTALREALAQARREEAERIVAAAREAATTGVPHKVLAAIEAAAKEVEKP